MNWMAAHSGGALRRAPRSAQVTTFGLLLTAVVVFAQAASQLLDFRVYYLNLAFLDSNRHGSVFGVLSILAQAVAAFTIGLHALSTRRMAGLLVAALIALLVVPRTLLAYVPSFQRYDVPILLAPLTVTLVVLCASTLRDPRRVRCMVWASLALLACSFALHAVGPQADNVSRRWTAAYTWSFQLAGMLKHGTELAGWMLLATGMASVVSPLTDEASRSRGLALDPKGAGPPTAPPPPGPAGHPRSAKR